MTFLKKVSSLHDLGFTLLVALLLSQIACSRSLVYSSQVIPDDDLSTYQVNSTSSAHEKIIGEKNLIVVDAHGENLPAQLRPFIDAIGQLNVGCTATHIGNGRVLTAGHCISKSPRSSSDGCHLLGVVWGNRLGNKELRASNCLKVLDRKLDSASDYAILIVSNPPETFVPVSSQAPDNSLEVTLLSFPHMRPLEWSGACRLLNYDDPIRSQFKFFHDCDTESGSSGAALMTLQDPAIIGIHGGSSDEFNYGMFTHGVKELNP